HYPVAGMADGQLDRAALDHGLAVRLAAFGAGPVEGDVPRGPALAAGDGRLDQRTADQKPLPVLVTAIGRPAPPLDVIEEALQGRRGVPRFRPPDLRGVLVRTRGPGHASSVGARAPGESGSGY